VASSAERVRKYRERKAQEGQKPLTVILSQVTHERIDSLKREGETLSELIGRAVEALYWQTVEPVTSNKSRKKAARGKKKPVTSDNQSTPEEDRKLFYQAYCDVGKGNSFVRIHRIRERLGWTRERFDQVFADLMAAYVIEPHGGDPSSMTASELADSFEDRRGIFYLTMTWRES